MLYLMKWLLSLYSESKPFYYFHCVTCSLATTSDDVGNSSIPFVVPFNSCLYSLYSENNNILIVGYMYLADLTKKNTKQMQVNIMNTEFE